MRKKINIILFGVLIVLMVFVGIYVHIQNSRTTQMPTLEDMCTMVDGNWLEEYQECEYIPDYRCEMQDWVFAECESACRHEEDAAICTRQCVPVCKFQKAE